MKVTELTREQLIQLKQRYLTILADEGSFAEVVGRDYDEPSYGDLADADNIVPDDVVLREYEYVDFVEEDFTVEDDRSEKPWDYSKHFNE